MEVTAKKAFGVPQPIDVTYVKGPAGANDQEGISCLFDHNPATKWCNIKVEEACKEIFFDTNAPVKAIQYSLTMAKDHESNTLLINRFISGIIRLDSLLAAIRHPYGKD